MSARRLNIPALEKLAKDADFQPAKLAALCELSDRQMQRNFQHHFQLTASSWLRALQCRLAKELIQEGFSSKAVMEELKFSNHSFFCHEFKRFHGNPPRFFARRNGNVAFGQ